MRSLNAWIILRRRERREASDTLGLQEKFLCIIQTWHRIDSDRLLWIWLEYDQTSKINSWNSSRCSKAIFERWILENVSLTNFHRKDCYRYYAGLGESNNIYQIPLNAFTDFINKNSGLVDGEILRFAESDTQFINVTKNNRPKVSMLSPANSLIRFQFLEIIIRLGIWRYFETGMFKNSVEAMKEVFTAHFNPVVK